jgi:MFS family permease
MRTRATNPWVVLVLISVAQFMVILDATIVNVALPSIQKDLHLSEGSLQWLVNAYTLVFGGFLLLGGRAGDLLGCKRVFLVGLVIFTGASLFDGLASSQGMLVGSRALQGLGAALISPSALSIISTTFAEGAERARALGVWAAIAIGGSAVGLILGGVLTQYFSWPWIFFVNVPVGIVAFLLSLRLIPESRDVQDHRSYDLAGAATVTGGLMALVYAIVDAQSAGWASAKTLGFFALAVVLLAGFVVVELRTRAPLVRLSIFRIRSLLTANITMFLAISGIFAMFFFNTLYIQQVLGYGPLKAGLAFLPFTAGVMISAGLASQFAPARRPPRRRGRDAARCRRAHAAHEAACARLLCGERAALDPALVARPGRGLHAADADRDDGPRRRGPGPRLRAVQHLAAGRRRARPGGVVDARGEQDVVCGRLADARARGRLPLGLRRRRSRDDRSARRDDRAPTPPPGRTHRATSRIPRDGDRRSLMTASRLKRDK